MRRARRAAGAPFAGHSFVLGKPKEVPLLPHFIRSAGGEVLPKLPKQDALPAKLVLVGEAKDFSRAPKSAGVVLISKDLLFDCIMQSVPPGKSS